MVTVKQAIMMQIQANGDQYYAQIVSAVNEQQTEFRYQDDKATILTAIGGALWNLCEDNYIFFDHYEQCYSITDFGALQIIDDNWQA